MGKSITDTWNLLFILFKRLCQTSSFVEMTEILIGIAARFQILGIPLQYLIFTVDNCCTVRAAIQKAFPNAEVVLDIWHFRQR